MGRLDIADYSTGVVSLEELIAQASTGNHAPNTPSNPSPINNAINISLNPLLNWDCSDPDGDSLTYDVFVNSDLIADDITNSQFQLLGLQSDRNYSWTIQAKDSHGATSISNPTWHFTTSQETPGNLVIQPGPIDSNDTFIEILHVDSGDDLSSNNYGNYGYMYVHYGYNVMNLLERKTLVSFTIPSNIDLTDITSAKVMLYGQPVENSGEGLVLCKKLTAPFNESTATYANSNGLIGQEISRINLDNYPDPIQRYWFTWNINPTNITNRVLSMAFVTGGGKLNLYASDTSAADYRPKLEIQYNTK
jgi:hypothetical protein